MLIIHVHATVCFILTRTCNLLLPLSHRLTLCRLNGWPVKGTQDVIESSGTDSRSFAWFRGQPRPTPRWRGSRVPYFWDPTYARAVWHKATNFCMIKLRDKKIKGRPCPWTWTIFCVTRMLTRDLFAVANFLVNHKCMSEKLIRPILTKSKCL